MRFVSNKTTIIVLGDDAATGADPRTDIISRISQRSKRIIWLNPEYRSAWGTGDSDMYRYAPFCNLVTVCNTLRRLEMGNHRSPERRGLARGPDRHRAPPATTKTGHRPRTIGGPLMTSGPCAYASR